jgi:hypothetical protein
MRSEVDTTLSAIDQALGVEPGACRECGRSLDGSPCPDFCSEDCQHTWRQDRAETAPTGSSAPPDGSLPETTPARPLGWLGQPPAGAITRAGHEVLDAVCAFLSRFSVFPDQYCAPTLALWYAHTHAVDQFYVTPRLVLDSAEPGSGKTRVLEVAQHLVAVPEMTISATTAALFRLVAMGPITILFDEVDAIFNPKNGGNNEDLRGLLNAGYKRCATIARCVGDAKNMKVQRFPVYAPAALVGIAGAMPATITTRAITIHMRRRRADEPVEPFRERQVAREAQPIRQELAAWIDTTRARLGEAMPQMPEGVTDRPAEIWEPLLALADTAGGHWPETARDACRHFVLNTGPQLTSLGVRLLADLRELFTLAGTERIRTTNILTALCEMDEAPWGDLDGKPLAARRLAKELDRFGVHPTPYKHDGTTVKGYQSTGPHGLADAWDRYLPPAHPPGSVTAVTAVTVQVRGLPQEVRLPIGSVTVVDPVPVAVVGPCKCRDELVTVSIGNLMI